MGSITISLSQSKPISNRFFSLDFHVRRLYVFSQICFFFFIILLFFFNCLKPATVVVFCRQDHLTHVALALPLKHPLEMKMFKIRQTLDTQWNKVQIVLVY